MKEQLKAKYKANKNRILGKVEAAAAFTSNTAIEVSLAANPNADTPTKIIAGAGIATGCFFLYDGLKKARSNVNHWRQSDKIPQFDYSANIAKTIVYEVTAMVVASKMDTLPEAIAGAATTAFVVFDSKKSMFKDVIKSAESILATKNPKTEN